MAVTRKTDLAGYRGQVSVGGYAARPCLIPRSNRVSDLNCPQRGRLRRPALSNPPQVIADTITCCPQRGLVSMNIVLPLRSAY